MDDKEAFLSRWSRRKLAAKQDAPALPAAEPAADPGAAAPAPVADAQAAAAPQGQGSEYREFFDPRVDEKLRRTALKKLFSEPQFNVMDGLDTYIDDYSKPDPIPQAMLRRLNQAKDLLLFDDEKTAEGAAASDAAASAIGAPEVAASDPAAQDRDATVAAVPSAADSKND